MYCEECGSFVRDGNSYCPACGAKVIEVMVPTIPQAAPEQAQPAPAPAPQPVYSQPIQSVPPVTAGNAVPILQAPVVQAIPVSQQAGQPLARSVEIDPAYARRVQIEPPKPHVENPMAKAGLICGIISLPTMYLGCLNLVPVILGITFSIKGLLVADKLDNKPKAVTGLILSCFGGAMGIYTTVLYICNWANMFN